MKVQSSDVRGGKEGEGGIESSRGPRKISLARLNAKEVRLPEATAVATGRI
jgi:hypothetical protein